MIIADTQYGIDTVKLSLTLPPDTAMDNALQLIYDYGRQGDASKFYPIVYGLAPKHGYTWHLQLDNLLIRNAIISTYRLYNGSIHISLKLQFSPMDLVVGCRTSDLYRFSNDTFAILSNTFTALIHDCFCGYGWIPQDITAWQPSYVEYAANLYTNVDKSLVMQMLNKNSKSANTYSLRDYHSPDTDITTVKRGCKYKTNSATTAYDKERQMQNNHPNVLEQSPDDYDFIRFERQLGRNYLVSHAQQWGNPSLLLAPLLRSEICLHVLISGWDAVYPSGDFCSSKRMRRIIDASNNTKAVKRKLQDFARVVGLGGSLRHLKNACKSSSDGFYTTRTVKLSYPTILARIKAFDAIGVAPVPIPSRWRIDYIPSPFPAEWRRWMSSNDNDITANIMDSLRSIINSDSFRRWAATRSA